VDDRLLGVALLFPTLGAFLKLLFDLTDGPAQVRPHRTVYEYRVVKPPALVQKVLLLEHMARFTHQGLQHSELERREPLVYTAITSPYFACVRIQKHVGYLEDLISG
jgi:hypothetical protein